MYECLNLLGVVIVLEGGVIFVEEEIVQITASADGIVLQELLQVFVQLLPPLVNEVRGEAAKPGFGGKRG